ncbi:MAG: Uncharacterized protein FD161_3348 [Limisphaerales bacterium]|nr:MAG: Uncharacterized protein FD161_3348 [Limisphaerales bacterium]KAG0507863.1 MAG: Uncharacterized protein E1N63_3014 [Limisphaerales bacterium]TXT48671.1 MAG: Uncharacterized protein FD140_3606 [Limisphaerales bacterium]
MPGLTPRPDETVECRSSDGRLVALVELVPEDDWQAAVAELAPLVRLSSQEAKAQGEQPVQLRENGRYEYVVRPVSAAQGQGLKLVGNLVRSRKRRESDRDIGRIETGSHCGLLRLDIEEEGRPGERIATGYVEVRSIKVGYRDEYQRMLEFISAQSSQLLFDARASAQMPVAPKWTREAPLLQQQIEFLRETLASRSFDASLRRIESFPHQQLRTVTEQRSVSRPFRPGQNFNRQVSSGGHRVALLSSHPLAVRLAGGVSQPSLPARAIVQRKRDVTDTSENRFVKHAVTQFRDFLVHAAQVLGHELDESWVPVRNSAKSMATKLDEVLSRSFYREISPLRMLPLGSPVLQRKPGYRELLQLWQRFNDNSQVTWKGGEEVYHAGKRDVATLYEYWLFFQLLRWFCGKFNPNGGVPASKQLIEPASKGRFNLRLQRNWTLGPFEGVYTRNQRKLCARFHYNQRFTFIAGRNQAGSWTRAMHPDYTLTFWPADYTPEEAERQELAVHIHFDSKYRVESLEDLFGKSSEDADAEEPAARGKGNYKRADLLKMHAYRDAIRRSEGAYILYPGSDADRKGQEQRASEFRGFHEILPGLGAFAISPGPDGKPKGMEHLNRFLDEVLEHLSNRTTSRERVSYHLQEAYGAEALAEAPVEYKIKTPLPERDAETGERLVPPSEHSVLVGWYENADVQHLEWIRSSGFYNFRAGDRSGSIRIEPRIAGAKHLLLHTHGGQAHPGLWRIKRSGPRLFTAEELLRLGYPPALNPKADAIYAVYDVEPDDAYVGWKWDYASLRGKKEGRQSAQPFAVSLADVLAVHRI